MSIVEVAILCDHGGLIGCMLYTQRIVRTGGWLMVLALAAEARDPVFDYQQLRAFNVPVFHPCA